MASQLLTSINAQYSICLNSSADVLLWDSIFVDSTVEVSEVKKLINFIQKMGKNFFLKNCITHDAIQKILPIRELWPANQAKRDL